MKTYPFLLVFFICTTTPQIRVGVKKRPTNPVIKIFKKTAKLWIHTTEVAIPMIVPIAALADWAAIRKDHKSGLTGLNKNTLIIAIMYPAACASFFHGIVGFKKELYEPIANYLAQKHKRQKLNYYA